MLGETFFKSAFGHAGSKFFIVDIVGGILRFESVNAGFIKNDLQFVDVVDVFQLQRKTFGVGIKTPVGVDLAVNGTGGLNFARKAAAVGAKCIIGGSSKLAHGSQEQQR